MTLRKMPTIVYTDAVRAKVKDEPEGDVYAETVRDIYAQTFKLKKIDNSLVDKFVLNKYVYRGGKLE